MFTQEYRPQYDGAHGHQEGHQRADAMHQVDGGTGGVVQHPELIVHAQAAPQAAAEGATTVSAPMPGMIVSYAKKVGDSVEQGETVVILEAMKMENEIRAQRTGVVEAVHVSPGQRVGQGDVLLRIGS